MRITKPTHPPKLKLVKTKIFQINIDIRQWIPVRGYHEECFKISHLCLCFSTQWYLTLKQKKIEIVK